jgi:Secretion system C-terminal sorting domain
MKILLKIIFGVFTLCSVFAPNALQAQDIPACGVYHKPYNQITTLTGDSSIVDAFGNHYSPSELQLPVNNTGTAQRGFLQCDCASVGVNTGYFDLWFEDANIVIPQGFNLNTGLATSEVVVDDILGGNRTLTTIGQQRRRRVCEVFRYLSTVIVRPTGTCIPSPNTNNVNVQIKPTGGLTGAAAVAGPYYRIINGVQDVTGRMDGLPWLAINGGLQGGGAPFVPTPLGVGTYHGQMQFASLNNWYSGNTTAVPSGSVDLSTTTLHEALHFLGFLSHIDATGNSQFVQAGQSGWSRWDTYLRANSINMLSNSATYNWAYNNTIGTFQSLLSTCNATNHLQFRATGNTDIPIFTSTGTNYIEGSSFSHPCSDLGCSFWMARNGIAIRALAAHEGAILRTLGYNLNETLIPLPTGQSECPVAGNNDIGNNNPCNTLFATMTLCTGAGVTAPTLTLTAANLIINDVGATGIVGLELIGNTNPAIFNPITGLFSPQQSGEYHFKYIPTNGTCQGNVTYIDVAVNRCNEDCFTAATRPNGNVNPGYNNNLCNELCNPEFATNSTASNLFLTLPSSNNTYQGWRSAVGSPDIVRNLNGTVNYQNAFTDPNNNSAVMRFFINKSSGAEDAGNQEAGFQRLSLTPNQRYLLSFYKSLPTRQSGAVASTDFVCYLMNNTFIHPRDMQPSTFFSRLSQILPTDIQQTLHSETRQSVASTTDLIPDIRIGRFFTPNSATSGIIFGGRMSPTPTYTSWRDANITIDQTEIIPDNFTAGNNITLPSCGGTTNLGGQDFCMLSDVEVTYTWTAQGNTLLTYTVTHPATSATPVITVNGVAANTIPILNLNPSATTTYTLMRTVTNNGGIAGFQFSPATSSSNILVTVVNGVIPPTITATPTNPNPWQPTTLTATGSTGATYTWSTGATTAATTVLPLSSPTIYTVTAANAAGCTATASIAVTVSNPCSVSVPNTHTYPTSITLTSLTLAQQTDATYNIGSNVTLTLNTSGAFQGCTFNMGENSRIIFNTNTTWKVLSSTFQSCGNTQWQGIVQNGSVDWISDNIIGAKRGIEITAATSRNNIQTCTFLNNNTGIYLDAAGGIDPEMFKCEGSVFSAPAVSSNNALIGNMGIFITNGGQSNRIVVGREIGGAATNRNTFSFLRKGIMVLNASVNVQESVFNNIDTYGNTALESGSAIHDRTNDGRYYKLNVLGWGTTNTAASYAFTNCKFGVYTQLSGLTIENTAMNNVGTGIRCESNVDKTIFIGNGNSGAPNGGIGLGNRINATNRGIAIFGSAGSTLGRVVLSNNHVSLMTTATATAQGIQIEESNTAVVAPVQLLNNTVTMNGSSVDGIFVRNANGVIMSNNLVNINNQMAARSGIMLQNCRGIRNTCNTVSNITPAASQNARRAGTATFTPIALLLEGTIGTVIQSLSTNNTCTGVKIIGSCGGSILRGTTFNNHTRGLWIFGGTAASASNALFDAQPHRGNLWLDNTTTNYPASSAFYGAYLGTETTVWTAGFPPRFWYNPNTNPNQIFPIRTTHPSNQPNTWFVEDPSAPNFVAPACTTIGSGNLTAPANPNNPTALAAADFTPTEIAVAADALDFGNYADVAKWEAQKALYRKIDDYNGVIVEGSVIDVFRDSTQITPIADFATVDKATATAFDTPAPLVAQYQTYKTIAATYEASLEHLADLSQNSNDSLAQANYDLQAAAVKAQLEVTHTQLAQLQTLITADRDLKIDNALALNTVLEEGEVYQYNKKMVTDIQLSTIAKGNYNLSAWQWANIDIIAHQCPYAGGQAVFEAQGIHALISDEIYDNHSICEAVGIAARGANSNTPNTGEFATKSPSLGDVGGVRLYPNPAYNTVRLFTPSAYQGAVLQITTTIGQVLQNSTIQGTVSTIDISTLPEGVYFITLYQDGKPICQNKVVKVQP